MSTYLSIPGLEQKPSREWKGTCPFCKGADCFVVSQDGGRDKTGAFNCFKCPVGGDQIELVSMMRGKSRTETRSASRARMTWCNKVSGKRSLLISLANSG